METKKLLALVETVRLKSINRSAETLDYAQSGLSYMLDTLEDELGVKLLKRTHRGISLTDEGIEILPYVIEIIEKEAELKKKIKSITRAKSEVIRIGTYSSVAANWLPGIIKVFKIKFPDVGFEIRTGVLGITKWMDDDLIDIGILEQHLAVGYRWMKIKNDEMYIACHISSRLAKEERISLEMLSGYPVIFPSINIKNAVSLNLREKNIMYENAITLHTEDGSVLLSMVSSGLGVTFLSGLYSLECPAEVCMKPIEPPLNRSLGIIVNDKNPPTRAIKQFINCLKKQTCSGDAP
jgi:DNA-binding transcriptional LysR family regulator